MLVGGLASSSSRQTSQEARNARQCPHHPHPPSWRQLLPWVCASSFPSFIYRFTYISYGLSSSYVEGWTIHESWTVKKAECQRIDAFELQCWRRLLRLPWTARSNQSILKEINPEYSLEELMLKLKLQCFGHLMWRAELLEETLMLEKSEGRRRRRWQRMRWLGGITDSVDMSMSNSGDSEGRGSLVCCSSWGHKESDTTEWLNNTGLYPYILRL